MSATDPQARRPLAWRLALFLGITVLAVLLLTGRVVDRVVSGGFATVITAQQQQRLDDAAESAADRLDRPVRLQALVRRLATTLGGTVRVVADDGTVIEAFGRTPDGDVARYTAQIERDGVVVATLVAELPSSGSDRGFLPLFNATLLVGILVSGVAIAIASNLIARRLTRPLRDVADAARRLERGEVGARARGGEDRESAELATAFNAMADRLERSEALRRRAASDLAHDLATPATVLETQLQAMLDGVVPTDRANLEAARSSAARLSALVGELDDLASAEAAPLQARPGPVDLATVAAETTRALDGRAREHGVRLEVDVVANLAAWADAGHVARALQNVTANAIAHSPSGGVVTLTGGAAGPVVHLRVVDEGPGIAADDLPHLFERFYRGDAARTSDGGHGLGLTIARELLVANGGSIEVEATGSGGTTFRLTLPGVGPAR